MGGDPSTVIQAAQSAAAYGGAMADEDRQAIVRSLNSLTALGCLTPEGMERLRSGGSPTVTRGEHTGDSIEIDHILPCAIVPELAARFYNLEAMPGTLNQAKADKITKREVEFARRLLRIGLLSADGLAAAETKAGVADK